MRAARLLPAYHLQLVVLALLGLAGVKAVGWKPDDAGTVLAHALLWLNAWPWVPAHLGPWWSLAVEAVFYISLPLVLPLLRSRRRALVLLLVAALLALLWRAGVAGADIGIEQRIGWSEHAPGRWVQFVAGAVLAAWWSGVWQAGASARRATPPAGVGGGGTLLLALAALALLMALPLLGGARPYNGVVDARPFTWAWPLLTTLPVLALLHAVLSAPAGGMLRGLLGSAPLRGLGVVSYGLYLWHYPVQWLLRQQLGGYVPPSWGVEGFALASLLLTLPIAALSWRLLEQPVLRWAARRRARLSPPSAS
jgi:peptidoglycan/LPS O-acetylase OafA/YrhL